MIKPVLSLLSVLSIGLALAACGGGDAVSVDQPWARAASDVQPNGAVYFSLTVDHDDVLVGAAVPSSVADRAEIHEVVQADQPMEGMDDSMDDMDESMGDSTEDVDDSMDDMDESMGDMESGAMAPGMTMREVEGGIALTADETVVFEPGGYHVMLLELAGPLELGDEVELTLRFDDNDDLTVTVPVRESAP